MIETSQIIKRFADDALHFTTDLEQAVPLIQPALEKFYGKEGAALIGQSLTNHAATVREKASDVNATQKALVAELADDELPRQQRDADYASLLSLAVSARDTVRAVVGKSGLKRFRLDAAVPRKPAPLLLFVSDVMTVLANDTATYTNALNQTFTPSDMAKTLGKAHAALKASLAAVSAEEIELKDAFFVRNEALEVLDSVTRCAVDVACAYCKTAGRPDLSKILKRRLRPPATPADKPSADPTPAAP